MTHPIGPSSEPDPAKCAQTHACDVCAGDYDCGDTTVSLIQWGPAIDCPDPAHPEHRQEITACGPCSDAVNSRDRVAIGVRLRRSTVERELRRERARLLAKATVVPTWQRRAELAAQR